MSRVTLELLPDGTESRYVFPPGDPATARSHDLNQKARAERLKQQEEPPVPDYKTLQE